MSSANVSAYSASREGRAGSLWSDKARLRKVLMIGGVAVVLAIAATVYLIGGRYVGSDDSYVRANKLMVATDVSGLVQSVNVHQGQPVKKGDVLFTLDPRPFQIALENAQAALGQTVQDVESTRAMYRAAVGQIAAQKAQLVANQQTYARYLALAKENAIAAMQVDTQHAAVLSAQATLASLQQNAATQLAKLNGNPNEPAERTPEYQKAKATVDEAQRQLDHAVVRAPFDGTVSEVDSLQPGTLVVSALSAFTTTSAVGLIGKDVWVESDMKETDLTHLRLGAPVGITVDTYPGCKWNGHIDSVNAGSDSSFSALPAENASGNWVKVVQRIPVRIGIDHGTCASSLRAGMSAVTSIDTGKRRITRLRDEFGDMTDAPHAAHAYDSKVAEWAVLLGSMAGVLMQALDTTIANVALPYMMGELSATYEQITWVLTSYIIAAAIMTAPVGWMAARFGKKNFLITSIAGFTLASMLCGAATSLSQMVLFRLIQGVFGAALGPLSQAVMLDMYPPAQRGRVMAIWGMGVMLGPILGPTLGGVLTDAYSWRWVFYINVPFGLAACVALWIFFKDTAKDRSLKFDWFGFGALSVGLAALQLVLDRGTTKDWFSSSEIVIEALVAGIAIYLFLVHMWTEKKPFIPKEIFRDRNFISGLVLMFVMGIILLASSALISPYLQNLSGRSVTQTGFLMVPRGLGVMFAMMFAGRLTMKVDPRLLMTAGAGLLIWSLWAMTGWTPSASVGNISLVTFIQGVGMGLVFVPMNMVAFATLTPQLRTDGAGLTNLMRNIGSAIGVSVTSTILASSVQTIHAQLSGYASPFNRALGVNGPSMMMNPQIPFGLANLNSLIEYRAQVQAYANDFLFMFFVSLPVFVVIWLMKRPSFAAGQTPKIEVVD